MASSNAVALRLQKLLKKTSDPDKDERYMALSDLAQELAKLDLDEQAIKQHPTAGVTAPAPRTAAAPGAAQPAGLDSLLQLSLARTIVALLEDSSTDVQTVSVKCLALVCRRLSSEQLCGIIDKLSALICDPAKAESRDIYAIGLKTMVAAVAVVGAGGGVGTLGNAPPMLSDAPSLGSTMSHRILVGMVGGLKAATDGSAAELDIVATILDVTKEVLHKFGPQLTEMHEPLLQVLTPRLESGHDATRKRTISTLAALVPFLSEASLHSFVELVISQLARHELQAAAIGDARAKQRENLLLYTYLQMVSVVSTTAGARIGKYLSKIVPQLEKFLTLPAATTATSTDESQLLELWENSLSAFESLLLRCPTEFVPFLPSVLRRAEEFMRYDPNYVYADADAAEEDASMADVDDDVQMHASKTGGGDDDGWGGGDDDDGWGAADDDADGREEAEDDGDDASWKVRRAAVKVLAAFIRSKSTLPAGSTSTDGLASHYARLCDALLDRFRERDQNVKIVLIQAVQDLLRESATLDVRGVATTERAATSPAHHLGSAALRFHQGVPSILRDKIPAIVAACLKQLKGGATSTDDVAVSSSTSVAFGETKHYIFLLLLELVIVANGGLDAYLPSLLPIILANLTAVGKVELKIDAISLLRAIIELHSTRTWFPTDAAVGHTSTSAIVQALVQSFADTPYIQYRVEVLQTASSLITLLGSFKQQQAQQPHPQYAAIVTPALLDSLYSQLLYSTLQLNDVDQTLKEQTLLAIGSCFFFFGRELQSLGSAPGQSLRDCMAIVLGQRLTNELTRVASLRCITRITQAPVEDGLDVAAFVFTAGVNGRSVLDDLIEFLRKNSQILKLETTQTLIGLLTNLEQATARAGGAPASVLTATQMTSLAREIGAHLCDADLNLANSILVLATKLFAVFPAMCVWSSAAQSVQDADAILSRLMAYMRSPLLQQQNIAPVVNLCRTIIQLNHQQPASAINPHLTFNYLFDLFLSHLTQQAAGTLLGSSSSAYLTNMAQVIGAGLVLYIPSAAQSSIALKLLQMIQAPNVGAGSTPEALKQCALLILGEVGRHVDLIQLNASLRESVFFSCFASENESIRTASSVAFGHAMMGNVAHFVPTLLAQLQDASVAQRSAMLMLMLTSLKELIGNLTTATAAGSQEATAGAAQAIAFRSFLPALLPLLWSHAEHGEESVRSLVSEVLGGLVVIDSARIFPEMVRLLAAPQPFTRSVVTTALRHALTQTQHQAHATTAGVTLALDSSLLQRHLPSFLQLLRDPDLSVRRQAILTVNALAHSRSHAHHLLQEASFQTTILPILFKHLAQDQTLVRIVDLGPFKHKIDDGFPLRKAAYQTLDTLLEVASPSSLDFAHLVREASQGLADHDDIVILVYQMLEKCAVKCPAQLASVLDTMPGRMMDGVKEKLKLAKTAPADASSASATAPSVGGGGDASTQQRAQDVLRAAVRCFLALQCMPTIDQCPQFVEFYHRVLKTAMLARMIEEIKQQS